MNDTACHYDKTVILLGGSFNPPHEGHFKTAQYLFKKLETDEIWMLFSQNPDKDPATYASLEHRMNMARILAKHYDVKLVISDEEAKIAKDIGRNETFYILKELRKKYPNYKFIWAMGADSFANFHTWKERDDIMAQYPIVVVGRPGYTQSALSSKTATDFAHAAFDSRQIRGFKHIQNGWCYAGDIDADVSSSDIRKKLESGECNFKGQFSEVAKYALQQGLYKSNTCNGIQQRLGL
jgi:nicotinate-nucleotide adenylyltransferase